MTQHIVSPAVPAESVALPLPPALRRGAGVDDAIVAGRRLGRLLFGGALVGGAAVAALFTFSDVPAHGAGRVLLSIHANAWIVALVACVVGRVVGAVVQRLRDTPLSDALLFPSLALPAVGMSLLTPLSLHGLLHASSGDVGGFDDWSRYSLLIVGHAHLVLAGLALFATWRMARGERHLDALTILFITTGVACVPGIGLFAVPPVLVLVTGALFVPAMLHALARTAAAERALAN